MEDEIPDTKCKDIYCEVCRHNIKKLGWAKHLRTRKHSENEKGVEEVEKKQCRKCGCWRVLELYRGENATCNICLGYREIECEVCECRVRKSNWARHLVSRKHMLGGGGGKVGGDGGGGCFSFGGTVQYIEESNIYLCFVVCRLKRGLVT